MASVLVGLFTIIILLIAVVFSLSTLEATLRLLLSELRLLAGQFDEVAFGGLEADDETPDMIALLGAAYAPGRLRPQGEAIVEGALASRQMTSHELEDALLGGKSPEPTAGDYLGR